MYFELNPRSVNIALKNGVYNFDNNSGLGKTYLFSLLQDVNKYQLANCCTITYDETQTEQDVINKLNEKKYDIIFLDRFDLYVSYDICNALGKVEDNSIIFIDLKNLNNPITVLPTTVSIVLREGIMEVGYVCNI